MSISEEFDRAFSASFGSYCQDCGCGRTHFCSGIPDWAEPGELEALQEKARRDPDHYVDHGEMGLAFVDLGTVYVVDCPCGAAERYERWLWTHRTRIAAFLKTRNQREMAEMQRQSALIDGIGL